MSQSKCLSIVRACNAGVPNNASIGQTIMKYTFLYKPLVIAYGLGTASSHHTSNTHTNTLKQRTQSSKKTTGRGRDGTVPSFILSHIISPIYSAL